jgi:hypothetical protein
MDNGDLLSTRVLAIISLLLPSIVVIVVSIYPPSVDLPLLLPCIECLNSDADRHLLHAPTWTMDKEDSCSTGRTIF